MNEITNTKKARRIRMGLITSIVLGLLVYTTVVPYYPVVNNDNGYQMEWREVWSGNTLRALAHQEADPGTDESGILEVFFINHTATGSDVYKDFNDSALFQTWCNNSGLTYSSTDDFYKECAHGVAFDIVVRIRVNKTNCANATGTYGVFNAGRIRVNITSADLGIAVTSMTLAETSNATANGFIWINAYVNNSNIGYQLTANQVAAITEIKLECLY